MSIWDLILVRLRDSPLAFGVLFYVFPKEHSFISFFPVDSPRWGRFFYHERVDQPRPCPFVLTELFVSLSFLHSIIQHWASSSLSTKKKARSCQGEEREGLKGLTEESRHFYFSSSSITFEKSWSKGEISLWGEGLISNNQCWSLLYDWSSADL